MCRQSTVARAFTCRSWFAKETCCMVKKSVALQLQCQLCIPLLIDQIWTRYSRGQTKTTILVIMIWGPCTTLDSTFYCRNVEIRTKHFDFYELIVKNWWNEKIYPKNIGQTLNGPLKSWKIALSTPLSTLHLILKLGEISDGLFL